MNSHKTGKRRFRGGGKGGGGGGSHSHRSSSGLDGSECLNNAGDKEKKFGGNQREHMWAQGYSPSYVPQFSPGVTPNYSGNTPGHSGITPGKILCPTKGDLDVFFPFCLMNFKFKDISCIQFLFSFFKVTLRQAPSPM